jgi:hypothetical protein
MGCVPQPEAAVVEVDRAGALYRAGVIAEVSGCESRASPIPGHSIVGGGHVDGGAGAGFLVKDRNGRRNQYRIQTDLPLRDPINRQRTIGELLDLLVGSDEHREGISPRGTDDG